MKKIIYTLLLIGAVSTVFFYDKIAVNVDSFVKKTIQKKIVEPREKKAFDAIFKTDRDIPKTADLGSYLASVAARNNGDFDKSVLYLEKAYQSDKNCIEIKEDLYVLKGLSGDIQSLVTLLEDDFYKHKSLVFAKEMKVAHLIKEEKYQEAIQLLSSIKDKNQYILPLMAWSYVGLGNKEKAVEILNLLKEEAPFHQMKRYHLALVYDYFNDINSAKKYYNQLQGLTKDISYTFYISVKDFFERQKDWNEQNFFYKKYQQISAENPIFNDIVAQVGMGPVKTPQEGAAEVYYSWASSLGNSPDLAAVVSNVSVFLNPDHVMAKIWSAEILDILDFDSFAHKIYDEILEKMPKADIILYKKGIVYMHHNDSKAALGIFKDLLTRNVMNPVVLLLVAQNYDANGDCKSALPFYERTLFLMKRWGITQTKKVKFQTAQCYFKEKNFEDFEKHAYAALQEDPQDAQVLNYLAYSWLERDVNLKEAIVFLEKAYKQAPNSPDVLDSLAFAYHKQGEHEKALPFAERAVDIMGASSVANMHLGDIYNALGRKREAQSQYEKALALQFDLTPELEKKLLERLK